MTLLWNAKEVSGIYVNVLEKNAWLLKIWFLRCIAALLVIKFEHHVCSVLKKMLKSNNTSNVGYMERNIQICIRCWAVCTGAADMIFLGIFFCNMKITFRVI